MNLLAERVGDNWRAISLLSAAMALSACTVTTQAPIPPTATSPTVTPPLDEMRPLTATEKAALAKTLSQTLKDPSAPQFKWLPVAASGSGPIGYCGLVNVKNSSGGYVGFRRFFAVISKGPKGDYIQGRIEHIDGIPVTSSGNSTEDDAVQTLQHAIPSAPQGRDIVQRNGAGHGFDLSKFELSRLANHPIRPRATVAATFTGRAL
jgi:hypothetical protein